MLEVEGVETYPVKNAENHRTEKYELAQETLVVRRSSAKFYLGIKTRTRSADFSKDDLRIVFTFGKFSFILVQKNELDSSFPEPIKNLAQEQFVYFYIENWHVTEQNICLTHANK